MTRTPETSTGHDGDALDAGSGSSALISQSDYEAIAAAVMETERGRWFLHEYARRNRHADTQTVLDALARLEQRIETSDPVKGSDTSVALLSHNVIDLAEAITQVKREVQELGGQGDRPDHFNSATVELEAIVSQTETATGEILEAAEKIQEVLYALREEGANETQCDIIDSKIIDIYTACSFQDLTGQRSSKVVRLVAYVEKRVAAMMDVLGLSIPKADRAAAASAAAMSQTSAPAYQHDDERTDAHLLHGPSLDGEGNEQHDVDALFAPVEVADMEAGSEPSDLQVEQAEREAQAVRQLAEQDEEAFGHAADIISGDMVVELHDADILQRPAEEALIASALDRRNSAPDIFDIDMLDFDGPDMAETSRKPEVLPTREDNGDGSGRRMMIASLPDDFDVDGDAADIFEEERAEDQQPEEQARPARNQSADPAARQDIFDVDDFDLDTLPAAEETATAQIGVEELMLDQAFDAAETVAETGDVPGSEDEMPFTDEERIALFS